jgi:hypothetical protein
MKKHIAIWLGVLSLLFTVTLTAQNTTTLTGTVTDSDSQTWNTASWVARIQVPGGGQATYLSGGAVPTSFTGVLSSSGVISGSVGNNAQIVPFGTTWQFTVCSLTSAPCSTVPSLTVSGSTQNVGTYLSSQIAPPRIQAKTLVYAYNPTEVQNQVSGDGYLNTVSNNQYIWNGAWTLVSGGGGGVTSLNSLTGAISLAGSGGITITPSGSNITINGGGGGVSNSANIYSNNSQVQADSIVTSTNFGLVLFGDSITNPGTGATVNTNAYAWLLASDYGITNVHNYGVSGSRVGDQTYYIFSSLNPTDAGNPIVTGAIGTNNVASGTTDFLRVHAAGASWAALSSTNKILMGASGVTSTGTQTADTTFPFANGFTCTSGPCTRTYTASVGTPNVFYLWYKMVASGANISVTVDGSPATDTITSSTTISSTWTNGPAFQTSTVGLARFVATNSGTSASHTIVVTFQTGATVLVFGFPPIIRYRGMNHPRFVEAGIPPQQNSANNSSVQAINSVLIQSSQLLVGDGLDVPFVDVNKLDPVLDMASSATQNCPASTVPGVHPNDCGHRHESQLFESVINAVFSPANSNLTSPINTAAIPSITQIPENTNGNDQTSLYATGLTAYPRSTYCITGQAFVFPLSCLTALYDVSGYNYLWVGSSNAGGKFGMSFAPPSATPAQTIAGIVHSFSFDGSAQIGSVSIGPTGAITFPVNPLFAAGVGIDYGPSRGQLNVYSSSNGKSGMSLPATQPNTQIYQADISGAKMQFGKLTSGNIFTEFGYVDHDTGTIFGDFGFDASSSKITHVANGTSAGDAVNFGQLQLVMSNSATITPVSPVTTSCVTALCTSLGGTIGVTANTFTTGNFITLSWTATPTAYVCTVVIQGGNVGITHSVASTTGMTIGSVASIVGTGFSLDYSCKPN